MKVEGWDPKVMNKEGREIMRTIKFVMTGLVFLWSLVSTAEAHFGMIIPSDNMVVQGEGNVIELTISFSHPFERKGMHMERPKAFRVWSGGRERDLTGSLRQIQFMGHRAWLCRLMLRRPGTYIFSMEPKPYWEPSEDLFIMHYTKTVVAAFGLEQGWDHEVGLKTEIVPLSRPFGLYAGNVFSGIVKKDGSPVPFAEVEVEYFNQEGMAGVSNEYMITQTIRADGDGVFTCGVPWPGWWGFAALSASEKTIRHNGEEKEVELGAVIWVKFEELPRKWRK
jgi:cobalt/nickel transport protein